MWCLDCKLITLLILIVVKIEVLIVCHNLGTKLEILDRSHDPANPPYFRNWLKGTSWNNIDTAETEWN